MPIDFTTILMVAALALMVLFMMRNSRKQKADREALQSKIVKGANVMSTAGILGTVVSIDEAENEIVLETTPGTKIRLHRQAVVSVIEKPAAAAKPAAKSAAKPAASKSTTK